MCELFTLLFVKGVKRLRQQLNKSISLTQNNIMKNNYLEFLKTKQKKHILSGEIEAEKLNLLLIFNKGTNVCFSTKAPLLQNRCYVPLFIEL